MNSRAVEGRRSMGSRKRLWIIAAVVGGLIQVTVGFFTMTAIGLMSVALWTAVALVGLWLAATVLMVRTVRRAPLAAALIPVANGLLLWGVVTAGSAWLGWTA